VARNGLVTIGSIAAALEARLPGRIERAAASAALTTYRCGGPIAVLVRVDREDELLAVADIVGPEPAAPVLIIGGVRTS